MKLHEAMRNVAAEPEGAREAVRRFVAREVAPRAAEMDRQERFAPELLAALAAAGYFGWGFGGRGSAVECGMLHAEIGRCCTSTRCILLVHQMAAGAVARWGSAELRQEWLPKLSAGTSIAAFALSEPGVGSDAQQIETTAELLAGEYVLRGTKRWVTAGQLAGAFLVFAKCAGEITAFFVPRTVDRLEIRPIQGMLGARAAMLAELELPGCRIPRSHRVGPPGSGLRHVAAAALDFGRLSIAFGCTGMAEACLETALRYAGERRQFGAYLREHQLIQRMLTEMIVNARAARLLCEKAAGLRDSGDPAAMQETLIAKYFASGAAMAAAASAVQILGANGCSGEYPVERFFRDAKVMEIIEGSNEIQQIMIARHESVE